MSSRHDAGGTAMAGGARFEALAGAWCLTLMLGDCPPPWRPGDVRIQHVRGNTGQAVDDLLLSTTDGGWSFIQAKRSIKLGSAKTSAFGGVVRQFCQQLNAWDAGGGQSWERTLDPMRDALVLLVGLEASNSIVYDLPRVLERISTWPLDQEIDDALRSDAEKKIWSALYGHAQRAWNELDGCDPPRETLVKLCRLFKVHALAIEGTSVDVQRGREVLAAQLAEPGDVDPGWTQLVSMGVQLTADSRAFERRDVVDRLVSHGLHLKGRPDFTSDRQALLGISRRALDDLAGFRSIEVPDEGPLHIVRAVDEAMVEFARGGRHAVITGDPGAGKSAVLHSLAAHLEGEGDVVVLLSADTARTELTQLQHPLADVLEDWSEAEGGWLLVDALDAMRDPEAAANVRGAIRRVLKTAKAWRVIATCRVFDLRHSKELQGLFSGEPNERFRQNEFRQLRHLHVPLLEDDELDQVRSSSSRMANLLNTASTDLIDVLRTPFHLWLLAGLVGDVDAEGLAHVRGRAALLDEYWRHRVAKEKNRTAREAVLRSVVGEMVEEGRVWAVRLNHASGGNALGGLEHEGVLVPRHGAKDHVWLKFPHHAFFDFAVARLFLWPQLDGLVAWLKDEPTRALALRPSFAILADEAWDIGAPFWELAWRWSAQNVPVVVRLIPAEVLAGRVRSSVEVVELHTKLAAHDLDSRLKGGRLLGAALNALRVMRQDARVARWKPWTEVAASAAEHVDEATLNVLDQVLWTAFEDWASLDMSSKVAVHRGRLRVLGYVLDKRISHGGLLHRSIRTALGGLTEAHLDEVRALVERLLEEDRLAEYGYVYVSVLGQSLTGPAMVYMPDLVELAYTRFFGVGPAEKRSVPMGQSKIMPLTSTTEQDFEMGRWALGRAAPAFAKAHFDHATRAMLALFEGYAVDRHNLDLSQEAASFSVAGFAAKLIEDASFIWDSGTYSSDDAMVVLGAWEEALRHKLENDGGWESGIAQFLSSNRLAICWSRLLSVALENETLANFICELASIDVVLTFPSTHTKAVKFAVARHASDPDARERIEQVVVGLTDNVDGPRLAEVAQRIVLPALQESDLVTEAAIELRAHIIQAGEIRQPEPLFTSGRVFAQPFDWKKEFTTDGGPLASNEQAPLAALIDRVRKFQSEFHNSEPELERASRELSTLLALEATLDGIEDEPLRQTSLGYLAEACVVLARLERLDEIPGALDLVVRALLKAATSDVPRFSMQQDAQFADSPSWGMPSPRISAAQGAVVLGRRKDCPEVMYALVENLSTDPVASVRYQLASQANLLYWTRPDLMWKVLDRAMLKDENPTVTLGALSGPLILIYARHRDRCFPLVLSSWRREGQSEKVSSVLAKVLAESWIHWGVADARAALEGLVNAPWGAPDASQSVIFAAADAVRGMSGGMDRDLNLRGRALDLLVRVTATTGKHARELAEMASDDLPVEEFKSSARILEAVAMQVRSFGRSDRNDEEELSLSAKRQILDEIGPVVDAMMVLPLAGLAHYIVEGLTGLAEGEPERAFMLLHRVVVAASADGYQMESMAAREVVGLVKRYLADFPGVFESELCRNALVEVLDRFAGWPSAQRLLHSLDELFR